MVGDAGTLVFVAGTGGRRAGVGASVTSAPTAARDARPGRAAGRRAAGAAFPTPHRGTPAHRPHG
ncbi:hypothetical protein [Streptomyces albogriseolus]|uniref:hypothetical protein n=1 Tax=Streptomyces albogriseolus TaxID=1887 RepID=UPI0022582948|nr:hypothetical protein [Streptomyces viridodiastaticus]MCX4618638.1 hypothetical protein [Streptomyces viridodiastaticus]